VSALDEAQFAEMRRFLERGQANTSGALANFLFRSVGLPEAELPAARTPRFRVP
jgi:hypothetical protein